MKAIASKRYTWKVIANQYDLLIKEVLLTKKKKSIYADLQKAEYQLLEKYQLGHLQNGTLFYEKR